MFYFFSIQADNNNYSFLFLFKPSFRQRIPDPVYCYCLSIGYSVMRACLRVCVCIILISSQRLWNFLIKISLAQYFLDRPHANYIDYSTCNYRVLIVFAVSINLKGQILFPYLNFTYKIIELIKILIQSVKKYTYFICMFYFQILKCCITINGIHSNFILTCIYFFFNIGNASHCTINTYFTV